MSAPAGWYTQPNDPAWQRWWDGHAWTDHVRPATAAQAHPPTGDAFAPTAGRRPPVSPLYYAFLVGGLLAYAPVMVASRSLRWFGPVDGFVIAAAFAAGSLAGMYAIYWGRVVRARTAGELHRAWAGVGALMLTLLLTIASSGRIMVPGGDRFGGGWRTVDAAATAAADGRAAGAVVGIVAATAVMFAVRLRAGRRDR